MPETEFIEQYAYALDGIVLTHAHEDHMGAIPWIWQRLGAPVYCTPFAAELLRRKLVEADLLETVELKVVDLGSRFTIGPFDVELIAVTHSIPEPAALAIRTDVATVVHSGDWKLDQTPVIEPQIDTARFKAIGEEGVDVLVCDSTNVLREGFSPSERDVADTLSDIVSNATGRVAITTFASHVGRISSAVRAARACGREVVVVGRAMRNVIEAAREVGLMDDLGTFVEDEAYGFLPRNKTLLLCTGSQGEGRAALARIANDSHPTVTLDKGDLVVFSSKTIPGNEKAVAAVVNALSDQGVDIVTADNALIHSSGHPRQEELAAMYDWLKPGALVPMHGEALHLKRHAEFARERGISQSVVAVDGQMVRLGPGSVEIVDEVPAGRVHVDGTLLIAAADSPAKERRKLSFAGIVCVSVVFNNKGDLIASPRLEFNGVPDQDISGEDTAGILLDAVLDALDDMTRSQRRADDTVTELLRGAVRRAAQRYWGKRPRCQVLIHRL